ncbi:hypothetical protein C4580_00915 [Candidatus Woesearchaeota archaeon]|nr:MAG: hypothetical protein C4580_00915 [Candidatus Woesearchaeota archaeon]
MTFKGSLVRLSAREDGEVGLWIVEWVMQNRLDHDRVYKAGEVSDFCNKEQNRVHAGLEGLAREWREPASAAELEARFVSKRLGLYREVTRICYGYDVLKAMYQHSGGEPSERILASAVFLAGRLRRSVSSRPEGVTEYQWQKETARQEYRRFLSSCRNGLNEETGIIYDLLR